uniref:Cytochrome P450 n=1 Tax=Tetranychus urticae TaxID=32264 RepID=T1JYN1_TETUR
MTIRLEINQRENQKMPMRKILEITCERKAFLDLLLEKHLQPAANDGKPIIDLEGVQEEINTFLFAGYETTGTAIMWIIYLLETRSVNGSSSNVSTKEDCLYAEIQDKIYAEINSILEVLRLFPPVPMIARELDQEVILDGYPLIYLHPDSLNPGRFDSDHISSIPAHAFIPFSAS